MIESTSDTLVPVRGKLIKIKCNDSIFLKMKDIIEEMQLPESDSNEELETISNNYLLPLFDPALFEIRPERFRDKGIDHSVEIKKYSKYTNFRCVLQLKSTDSIKPNVDETYSVQMDTYNIQYLLNAGIPGFYVLFVRKERKFFMANLNDFVQDLSLKSQEWQKQGTHVLRFKRILDEEGIDHIYHETYKHGLFNREIRERIAFKNATMSSGDKVLFDADLNVSSDDEIRKIIEGIGFELINQCRWNDVLELHNKTSMGIEVSPRYESVIGLAYYYSLEHFESHRYFRRALRRKSEMERDLVNHVLFFNAVVKRGLGMLSEVDFESELKNLEGDENLRFYIKIDNAKKAYVDNFSDQGYEQLIVSLDEILNDNKANDNVKLAAQCEKALYTGYRINQNYFRNVAMINALEIQIGPNLQIRKSAIEQLRIDQEQWAQNIKELKESSYDRKNYFIYYMARIFEVKVIYEFEVYTEFVRVEQELPGFDREDKPDNTETLNTLVSSIDAAISYFNEIGHSENRLAAQSTKYEILHFMSRMTEANSLMIHMKKEADIFDLAELTEKLEALERSGTTHERLKAQIEELLQRGKNQERQWETMREEMVDMDEQDLNENSSSIEDSYCIQLFPIGFFEFPKKDLALVYETLNVILDCRKKFDDLFMLGVIPVANILNLTVAEEGPLGGMMLDKGFESWKNVYRVRKSFFDSGFRKIEINN